MKKQPIVWTIAGSDAGGGAGIQADLLTFHDFGVHGCSVITAVTAQNSVAISHIEPLSIDSVQHQLAALACDLPAQVIKIGMLANEAMCQAVGDFLATYEATVVVDPVMVATSGQTLLSPSAHFAFIKHIIPHATILTPNMSEAQQLTQISLDDPKSLQQAAQKLLSLGTRHVLITGVHGTNHFSQDCWYGDSHTWRLTQPWLTTQHTHGSGCSLASALSAALALGYEMADALVIANLYVHQGLRQSQPLGKGPGPVAHTGWSPHAIDLPRVTCDLDPAPETLSFADMKQPIGFYPIVPDATWVETLISTGISTLQLRMKDCDEATLRDHIARAVTLCRQADIQLFINDHWQLAIEYGAFGVHLGQDDLFTADLTAIAQAGLRLGVSTHSYFELARAQALHPSYLALGPIFATTSKVMPFQPQGIDTLWTWRQLTDTPLVAIGGISFDNVTQVMATEVDGVAAISLVTQANDPVRVTQQLQAMWHFS